MGALPTGKEEDVEVGLTYFGKRYLNPLLGRWVSPDPLGVHVVPKGDLNLYAYVHGRALAAIDPVGLDGIGPAYFAPSGRNELEKLANWVRSPPAHWYMRAEVSRDTVRKRVDRLLDVTRHWAIKSLHTGGWTRESYSGFRAELQDPAQHRKSANQVGHFLTAVSHAVHGIDRGILERMLGVSIRESARLSARQSAIRLDIGHELAPDPDPGKIEAPWRKAHAFQRQYAAATPQDVAVFERTLSRMSSDPNATIDFKKLRGDLAPILGRINESQRGNSKADLLLTVAGWKFGDMVREGRFANPAQAADWIERNLGAAAQAGQKQAESESKE